MAGYYNKREYLELTPEEVLWVQTGLAGVVVLVYQDQSPDPIAGSGQVFTKSDGNLYYLDGSGVEYQITGGGGGITVEIPTGTVNSSNQNFGVSDEPKWVIADGITYFDGEGYTYAANNVAMDIPPSIFIRAII